MKSNLSQVDIWNTWVVISLFAGYIRAHRQPTVEMSSESKAVLCSADAGRVGTVVTWVDTTLT